MQNIELTAPTNDTACASALHGYLIEPETIDSFTFFPKNGSYDMTYKYLTPDKNARSCNNISNNSF